VTEEEKKAVDRRRFLKYVGAGAVVVVGGAAAAYLASQSPQPSVPSTTAAPTSMTTAAATSSAAPTYSTEVDLLLPPWAPFPDDLVPEASQASNAKIVQNVIEYSAIKSRIVSALVTQVAPAAITEVDSLWVNSYKDFWVPIGTPKNPEPKYNLTDADMQDMSYLFDAQPWYNIDGKLVAIPYSCDFSMMTGNRPMLEKAGYDKWPTTWDEMRNVCEDMIAKGATDSPFLMECDATTGFPWGFWPFPLSYGGAWFDDQLNPLWDTPDSGQVKALQWLHDAMWKWGIIPKSMLSSGQSSTPDQFDAGKGGIVTITIGHAPSLDANPSTYPATSGKVDEFLIPSGTPDLEFGPSVFGTEGLGICKYSPPDVQDAAWKFIYNWRTTTDTEVRMAKLVALSPPRMSAWNTEASTGFLSKKYADPIFAALKANKGWGTPKGAPLWYPELWDDIAFYMNQVMSSQNGMTPQQCWHTLALKIPEYKKKYGGDYPPG
jgi:hypothetical protein